jgi:hypothetical protein
MNSELNTIFGEQQAQTWCDRHGWTDLSRHGLMWWAFEGQEVMPKPLPDEVQIMANLSRAVAALNTMADQFQMASVSISRAFRGLADYLPQQTATHLTPLEEAIDRIKGVIPRPIAIARARQFCQSQNLIEAHLIVLIDQSKVQMCHGTLCYVKRHRRADWRRTSPVGH